MDLKHLKLRKESKRVVDIGLMDLSWVKTGPLNQLMKLRDQLNQIKPLQEEQEDWPKVYLLCNQADLVAAETQRPMYVN